MTGKIHTHDEAIDALCGCARTVTVLSYQEAIEGYFSLRGLPIPADHPTAVDAALGGDEASQEAECAQDHIGDATQMIDPKSEGAGLLISDAIKAKYERVKATTYNPGTPSEKLKDGILKGLTMATAIAMVEEDAASLSKGEQEEAVALSLDCPKCSAPHIDEGEWATRLHKTHQCQSCGHEWRPFPYPTVGVAAPPSLPGREAVAVEVEKLRDLAAICRNNAVEGSRDEKDAWTSTSRAIFRACSAILARLGNKPGGEG